MLELMIKFITFLLLHYYIFHNQVFLKETAASRAVGGKEKNNLSLECLVMPEICESRRPW